MEFQYSYGGDSRVQHGSGGTAVSFAPDVSREPTFFRGELSQNLAFREAMSALHDVVVSDLRWQPKDRTEYLEWAKQQEEIDWATVAAQQAAVKTQIDSTRQKLDVLRQRQRGARTANGVRGIDRVRAGEAKVL